MATVKTKEHDAKLTAKEVKVILRVELAMKSVSVSSGRDMECVVPNPDQKIFRIY